MCVILACKSQKPTFEILEKCHAANSDGAGIAWFNETNLAQYKKGLNVKDLFDIVEQLPLPFCIHFRAASNGGKSNLLTHPFEVTRESQLKLVGESEKLLMHNGHFNDYKICLSAKGIPIVANDTMSDTRAIAMIISDNNQNFLKDIGKGKFIFIDAARKKFCLYGNDFTEENGILYSNMTWKYGKTTYYVNNTAVVQNNNCTTHNWQELKQQAEEKKAKDNQEKGITITNVKEGGVVKPRVSTKKKIAESTEFSSAFSPTSPEELKLLLKRFSCPPNLSKGKQKKLFKRWCRQNNIHFASWRETYKEMILSGGFNAGVKLLTNGASTAEVN